MSKRKNYIAIELILDGSRQEYLELGKKDLARLRDALGIVAVMQADHYGSANEADLNLMRKIGKLLRTWLEQEQE